MSATKKSINTNEFNDVVDINLNLPKKKRFRIDGDNNRILELDVADLNILVRINEAEPKLTKLLEKAQSLSSDSGEDEVDNIALMGTTLKEIDIEMRSIMDEIFNSNVSEICAPSGNMFDLIEGDFRYQRIITSLTPLYETNAANEVKALNEKMKKHTDKYKRK